MAAKFELGITKCVEKLRKASRLRCLVAIQPVFIARTNARVVTCLAEGKPGLLTI